MNSFTCTARLGNDCEVRQTKGGTAICSFNGAVDSGFGDNKKALWIRFAIFGKRAEGRLPEFLVRGCQVAISGELSMNEWEDKDGNKRSTLKCNVNNLDLVGGKPHGQQSNNEPPASNSGSTGIGGASVGDDIPF